MVVATTQPAIIKACQRNTFHVAVVSQEENPEKKKHVFALIRRHCPSTKILEVYPIEVGRTLKEADDWLALPKQEPTELIERVATLVRPQPFGTNPKVIGRTSTGDRQSRCLILLLLPFCSITRLSARQR
jgi:hypothetical protein